MQLTPFERWFPADARRAAEKLAAEAALERLARAGLPVPAPVEAPGRR
jgi:hypothetical protein